MLKLNSVLKRDHNNLNLIRLIAALMVIYGHSFYLFRTNGKQDLIRELLGFDYSGSVAVYIFFFLSGIFITGSFLKSETFGRFMLMRIFRIWPALLVCLILTVFLAGPLLSDVGVKSYFTNSSTWRYLLKTSTLYHYDNLPLPGVFMHNYLPKVVNGSLWTLPSEVKCYFLIFCIGCFGLLKKYYFAVILFLGAIILYLTHNPTLLTYFNFSDAEKQAIFFIAGCLFYRLRNEIIMDYRLSLLLLVLCISLCTTFLFQPLCYITICYGTLTIGASGLVKKWKFDGDYSYGIYIYGFLVQQICYRLYPDMTSYSSMLLTLPLTILLAVCSWHLIEKPANELAHRLSQRYLAQAPLAKLDLRLKNNVSSR